MQQPTYTKAETDEIIAFTKEITVEATELYDRIYRFRSRLKQMMDKYQPVPSALGDEYESIGPAAMAASMKLILLMRTMV